MKPEPDPMEIEGPTKKRGGEGLAHTALIPMDYPPGFPVIQINGKASRAPFGLRNVLLLQSVVQSGIGLFRFIGPKQTFCRPPT